MNVFFTVDDCCLHIQCSTVLCCQNKKPHDFLLCFIQIKKFAKTCEQPLEQFWFMNYLSILLVVFE